MGGCEPRIVQFKFSPDNLLIVIYQLIKVSSSNTNTSFQDITIAMSKI